MLAVEVLAKAACGHVRQLRMLPELEAETNLDEIIGRVATPRSNVVKVLGFAERLPCLRVAGMQTCSVRSNSRGLFVLL